MRNIFRHHWFFLLLLVPMIGYYFWGVSKVPFHPDESTQLFMSADFDRLFTDPTSMAWLPDTSSPISRYRSLDAPLTRYLLGMGRTLYSLPAPTTDWNWSLDWNENIRSGAHPDGELLNVGRMAVACLFPITLVLLYLTGTSINGRLTGIIMVLVIGVNAVVLLHTRRAMAEGALLFGVTFTLYALISADKRPALIGLAIALAFNAKQFAIALIPVGLLAVSWLPDKIPQKSYRIAFNISLYLTTFFFITILLNPFLWRHPISAARAAIEERHDFLASQIDDINNLAPGQLLDTPIERTAILLAQLFLTPPMFSEVGNYQSETSQAEILYLVSPGHMLGRNPIGGGLLLGLTLIGIFAAVRGYISGTNQNRRILLLFMLASLAQIGAIILLIPLPWQRYYIPVFPFYSLFVGLGAVWVIKISRRILSSGKLLARLSEVLSQFSPDSWMP